MPGGFGSYSPMETNAGESDIAVIGLSCRFAGASSPHEFWRLLNSGASAIGPAPRDRWGLADGDAEPDLPPELSRGAFLDRVDEFDADFFAMAPREAAATDPQQRLMLELGWEAFEDAGIVPSRAAGAPVGVFIGAASDDFAGLSQQRATPSRHTLTGVSRGMIANRISFCLGLGGPSLTVDAAQASSLVAVHAACQSLRTGDTRLALAGGVNLALTLEGAQRVSEFGALSPTGECRPFDARASGYVRGEGGAAVLLKPLADALDDGDPVYCTIRGGAVTNDGGGDGLTVPSEDGQSRALRLACRRGGVAPHQVDYVEAHGTGTRVGDPVEARALGRTFGAARPRPLRIGSVKATIGHLEAASGIAGLLKTALSLHHGRIPASLNFRSANLPMQDLNLEVAAEGTPWPQAEGPRLAGVSSFGMGGTNCHLILAGRPDPSRPEAEPAAAEQPEEPVPWVLSAKSAPALRAQAARLAEHLDGGLRASAADVGYSLARRRTRFAHQAVVVAREDGERRRALRALAHGRPSAAAVAGRADADPGRTAFVFSGQGAQRNTMGRGLGRAHPGFARHLDAVLTHMEDDAAAAIRGAMSAPAGAPAAQALHRTEITQPALFAFEVAAYRLLESWGLRPDAVAGHSIGEFAAAHVAGVLDLKDACTLVGARGRLMQALPDGGAMLAVGAGETEALACAEGIRGVVDLAAVNGPRSAVLSGQAHALAEVQARCRRQGVRTRMLHVSHAFHSALMDPVLEEFRSLAETLNFGAPRLPVVSTVTGAEVTDEMSAAEYWVRHARRTVRFSEGVAALAEAKVGTFVEVGPSASLLPMLTECLGGQEAHALALLPRGEDEAAEIALALGRLQVRGIEPDWRNYFAAHRPRSVALPTYPFQRRRFWPDSASSSPPRQGAPRAEPEEPLGPPGDTVAPWLVRELGDLTPTRRAARITHAVRAELAEVLGHAGGEAVDPQQTFQAMGLDSVGAVELRERLAAATGLELPASLVYDHPTPADVAMLLSAGLTEPSSEPDDAAEPDKEALHRALDSVPLARLHALGLADTLLELAQDGGAPARRSPGPQAAIDTMDTDDLVRFALNRGDAPNPTTEPGG